MEPGPWKRRDYGNMRCVNIIYSPYSIFLCIFHTFLSLPVHQSAVTLAVCYQSLCWWVQVWRLLSKHHCHVLFTSMCLTCPASGPPRADFGPRQFLSYWLEFRVTVSLWMYLGTMSSDREPLVSESTWHCSVGKIWVICTLCWGGIICLYKTAVYYHNGAVECDMNFKHWPYWKEFI